MINWDEVDEIKQRLLQRAKYGITCADDDLYQLLKFLDQFRPRPFDPDDRMTWPEMETEVLTRFGFGWKVAKLCYTVTAKNPIWKTDNEKLDYAAGIEWQPLPPVGKEGER
jgi:hypothetical protein